jgi:hypothetical protein
MTIAPPGYTIRTGTAADVAAVVEFHAARTGAADGEDFDLVARDPGAGPAWSALAVHDATDTIAASLTLLDEQVGVGDTMIPAGQVEMVASDAEHEGRGLVRALMEWSELESRRRGHLIQPMIGIPYFYRQFGYVYSAPLTPWADVLDIPEPAGRSCTVRRAHRGDTAAIQSLIEQAHRSVMVTMAPSTRCIGWIIERSGSDSWVVERHGHIVGFGRSLPATEGHAVGDLVGDDDAAAALCRHLGAGGLRAQPRPGTSHGGAPAWLRPIDDPHADWLLARVPDVTALLERLRPELQRRLDAGGLDRLPERLLISSYRTHVVAEIADGRLGPFTSAGALQAPVSAGGAGIPPDVWGPLLLGPFGAVGLEARHPDVLLGDVRELMAILFPPVTSDFMTFYLTN